MTPRRVTLYKSWPVWPPGGWPYIKADLCDPPGGWPYIKADLCDPPGGWLYIKADLCDPQEGDGRHEAGHEWECDRQDAHLTVSHEVLLCGPLLAPAESVVQACKTIGFWFKGQSHKIFTSGLLLWPKLVIRFKGTVSKRNQSNRYYYFSVKSVSSLKNLHKLSISKGFPGEAYTGESILIWINPSTCITKI